MWQAGTRPPTSRSRCATTCRTSGSARYCCSLIALLLASLIALSLFPYRPIDPPLSPYCCSLIALLLVSPLCPVPMTLSATHYRRAAYLDAFCAWLPRLLQCCMRSSCFPPGAVCRVASTSCTPQAREGPDTCKPKAWAAANPGKTHAVFNKDTCPGGSVPALPKQVPNATLTPICPPACAGQTYA